jgi:hypothetical protein
MIKEFKKLDKDWKNIIMDNMGEGAMLIEVLKKLEINYRTHAKFMKDHEEYRETIEYGRMQSEAWWVNKGRTNLLNKKEFDNSTWIFTMKAVFGWREALSLDTKGSVLPKKEDEAELLAKYEKQKDEEKGEEIVN